MSDDIKAPQPGEMFRIEFDGCVICDKETARKVWKEEPRNRHRIYLFDEYKATVPLDNATLDKIAELKKRPEGFVYRKGVQL